VIERSEYRRYRWDGECMMKMREVAEKSRVFVKFHISSGICVRVELHQEMDAPEAGNGGSQNGKWMPA
jgi:hypothetical protein